MPGENIYDWSITAANNGTADSSINWVEGQARASVNNSARSMMAAQAKNRNLQNGSITTGGTANAQTFTSGVTYTTVPTGIRVLLKIGAALTNTGPTTLNMDGIGAVAIFTGAGVDIQAGELIAGYYAELVYNGTNWILVRTTAEFVKKTGDTMTGLLTVPTLTSTGTITATGITATGITCTGITCNGSISTLSAGNISANGQVIANGGIIYVNALPAGNYAQLIMRDSAAINRGTVIWDVTTSDVILRNNTAPFGAADINLTALGQVKLGGGFLGRFGYSAGVYSGIIHNFLYDGTGLIALIGDTSLGYVSVSSDYRIKKDIVDLPSTWETVKALHPIKYTQAEYTPPVETIPTVYADEIERWGFIAHELQETLVESAATGVKDQANMIQSPNPLTIIAALTKALQEAMMRIEALEAKVG